MSVADLIWLELFQSTSPVRGTTVLFSTLAVVRLLISIHVPREGDDPILKDGDITLAISIHVPREGDDKRVFCFCPDHPDFNPRPP